MTDPVKKDFIFWIIRTCEKKGLFRFRLLPVVIFSASILLTFKLGYFVTNVSDVQSSLSISEAIAEEQAVQPQAKADLPQPGADPTRIDDMDPLAMTKDQYQNLEALKEQRQKLEHQANDLPKKEAALKTIEKKIDEKTKALQEAQAKLEGLVKGIDEKEKVNLEHLVKMSEAMKPDEAAPILEGVDFPILLDIMEHLKPAKASGILAAMDPHKAAYLMTQLALRKKVIKLEGGPAKTHP